MAKETKKFLIIDGNALVHRAFHALPPLKTKRGELVNAVYGFCLIFLKAIKEIKPECVVATFDLAGPTFRHKQFKEYKAKRQKAPDELYQQLAGVKKLLRAFNVPIFEKQGFEADDLIGTVVKEAKRKQVLPKIENIILTGDMDALQLVDEQTKVYTMRKGIKDTVLYDVEKTKARYDGLTPKQLTDFRALRGDPSDNIPGVTGIGQKTAIELLKDFETLEKLYEEVEKETAKAERIKPGVLQKLKQYKDQAFISQKLATIDQNVEIDFKLKDCQFGDYDKDDLIKTFQDFEFYALLKKLPQALGFGSAPDSGQQGLFGVQSSQTKQERINDEIDKLEKEELLSVKIAKLERDLAPLIETMEKNGILLDIKALNKLSEKLAKEVIALEKKIFKLTKTEFNLNSPQQVAEALFEKLKISKQGVRKTPGGAISTGVRELQKLREEHPVVSLILEYRELFKLKSGFVDSLAKDINPKTGRLHPHFHQLGTETGRMSCSDPNLQNIPIKGETAKEIRKTFVPQDGFKFVSADYSQMELRIAAAVSGDQKMLATFKKGEDIHSLTAKEIGAERYLAKTINFAVLYGMGSLGVAERANISRDKAKEFIEKYFKEFEGITKYIEEVKEKTREQSFSQTIFGRKRFLPEIDSLDNRFRAQAERMAVNMVFQGSSADIMKMAMVALTEKGLLDKDCRLLLQIHDELLFEIKEDAVKTKTSKIKKVMENVVELKAPLVVDLKIGSNWGEMRSVV